jgi:hypothetical protein
MEVRGLTCKICSKVELGFFDGNYPDGKNKRWKNAEGILQNGRVCGACNNERIKNKMKEKRKNNDTRSKIST